MKQPGSLLTRLLPAAFVLSVFFLGLGCKKEKEPVAPPSAQGPRAVPVNGFVVTASSLEQIINATGNLIAYESVEIRPERAGKLLDLNFSESAFVKEGQLLARIDDSELIAQKARLSINLDLAQKEVARGKELLEIQGISKEEIDRLENRVEEIKAEQNILDVQISKSKVYAPFSGTLGLRQVSRGAYVTPNDVIIQLQQINPIKLEFDVPEKFLPQVRVGQELTFTIVGSERVFKARVYAIAAGISPVTRTFKVRASAANTDNLLVPGQFAKVTLVTGVNDSAMLIPTDAVVPVLNGKQVYLARKGRAIATFVETNDRQATSVEVTHGLQIGDTILVSGLLSLTDGAMIQVTNLVEQPKNQQ